MRKASPYDKIKFLRRAEHMEVELLNSIEVYTRCYETLDQRLVFIEYINEKTKVWTRLEEIPYRGLHQISMDEVLRSLSNRDKKELILNWNLLRGVTPDIKNPAKGFE